MSDFDMDRQSYLAGLVNDNARLLIVEGDDIPLQDQGNFSLHEDDNDDDNDEGRADGFYNYDQGGLPLDNFHVRNNVLSRAVVTMDVAVENRLRKTIRNEIRAILSESGMVTGTGGMMGRKAPQMQKPQHFLTQPADAYDPNKLLNTSLKAVYDDIIRSENSPPDYGFGLDSDDVETAAQHATQQVNRYGHGAAQVRRPGPRSKTAGYMGDK